jgi:3',5'-cyclic AMP phosphodiesterase CpdA
MITLAHLSDIHLAPLPPVRPRDLLSKRLTGFINWQMARKSALHGDTLMNLVQHLRVQNPDFTAVTGDLVNLALDAEINTAFNWLQTVGTPERVCVSPGNHDAYVRGALAKAQSRWGEYLKGETVDEGAFPFVRRIGDVAVISCSSAVPTMPFIAAGRFDDVQAARLAQCLKLTGEAGYFRVVLIHHPPNVESQHPGFGLWGSRLFRSVIAAHGAEIILHGHTHRSSMHSVHGPKGEVPVIGVAAAGAMPGGLGDPARYNFFRVERNGAGWSCTMREFGYQRLGTEIVMRLQMRIY